MGNVRIIDDRHITQLADTIRSLKDSTDKYYPSDIPSNIENVDMGIRFNSVYGGAIENAGLNLDNKYVSNIKSFFPVIGYEVTSCVRAFFNCRNAVGDPIMKSNIVSSLSETFAECWSLTGAPQCGVNVTNLTKAYYNCQNLDGRMKQFDDHFENVTLAVDSFYGDLNLTGSPTYFPKATNMFECFFGCSNLTGTAYIPETATAIDNAFAGCSNIESINFVGDSSVSTMGYAFDGCENVRNIEYQNISKVTNMVYAFRNCRSLTGQPFMPDTVTGALAIHAFRNCHNLTGQAVISPALTDGRSIYAYCENITAVPTNGSLSKLTRCDTMFAGCRNMHGSLFFTTATLNYTNAFMNCMNLGGVYIPHTNANIIKAANIANAFAREPGGRRLNVVFKALAVYNIGVATAATGCAMTSVTAKGNVQFPFCYNNGKEYGYEELAYARYAYNEEYNLYVYCQA